jgi:L-rhamnose mutarotase
MKNWIIILSLMVSIARIGHSQTWEEMAQYVEEINSRNDSIQFIYNDTITVKIRDFGIHQFTIFNNVNTKRDFFIYRCNCSDSLIVYDGGISRDDFDFWQSVYIMKSDSNWVIETVKSEIALSIPWSHMSGLVSSKKCIMTK